MKKSCIKTILIFVFVLTAALGMSLTCNATGTAIYCMDIDDFETTDGTGAPRGMLAINAENTGSDSTSAIFKSVYTDDMGSAVEIYKGKDSSKGVYMTQMGMSLTSYKVLTYDITFKRDYVGNTPFYLNIRFPEGHQIPIFKFKEDMSIQFMGADTDYHYNTGIVYRIRATFDFENNIAVIQADGGEFKNNRFTYELSSSERPNRIDIGFNIGRAGTESNVVIGKFALYEDVSPDDLSFRLTDIIPSGSYNELTLTDPIVLSFSDTLAVGFDEHIFLKEKESGECADLEILSDDNKTLTITPTESLKGNKKYALIIDEISDESGNTYSYEKEFSTIPLYKTSGIKLTSENTIEIEVIYSDRETHDDYFFVKIEDEDGVSVFRGENQSDGHYVFSSDFPLTGKTVSAYLLDKNTFEIISLLQPTLGESEAIDNNEFLSDVESKQLILKGNIGDMPAPSVMFAVLNPGFSADNIGEDGCVNYLVNITPGSDGSFYHAFQVYGKSGYYSAYTLVNGEVKEFCDSVFYASKEHIDEALDKISANKDETDVGLKSNLEELSTILGLDMSIYYSMSSDEQLTAVQIMRNNRDKYYSGKLTTVSEAQKVFYDATLICALSQCKTPDELTDILQSAPTKYFDSFITGKLWLKFDRAQMKEFSGILIDNKISEDYIEFCDDFEQSVVLCSFRTAEHWSEIKTLMKDAKDILKDVDYAKYEKKSDTSSIDKNIIKSEFEDFDDLVTKINKCINAKEPSNTGGGGGASKPTQSTYSGGPMSLPSKADDAEDESAEEKTEDMGTNVTENKNLFSDMGEALWATDAIYTLYQKGIISGRDASHFYPLDPVTREEFVKMVYLAFLPISTQYSYTQFSDVDESRWSYEYISKCANAGIISGTGDGKFSPEEKITREDMAKIIYSAISDKIDVESKDTNYADFYIVSDYARNSVEILSAIGVVRGENQNLFNPKSDTTRAAAAQIIYNALNAINE